MDASPATEAAPSPSWRWLRQRTVSEGQQSSGSSHVATPSSGVGAAQSGMKGEIDASPSSTQQTTPEIGAASPSGSSAPTSPWSKGRYQKARPASPRISASSSSKDVPIRPDLRHRTDSSGSGSSAKARRVLMPNIPQRKTSSASDTQGGFLADSPLLGQKGTAFAGAGGGMSPSSSQSDIKSIAQAIAARAKHVAAANARKAAGADVADAPRADLALQDPRSVSSASARSEDALGVTSDKSDASTPKATNFDQTAQNRAISASKEGPEGSHAQRNHKGHTDSFAWADGDWADYSDVLRENIDFGGQEETLVSPASGVFSNSSRHSKSETMSSISSSGRDMAGSRRPSGSAYSHGTSQTSAPEELPYLIEAQQSDRRQRDSGSSSDATSSKRESASTQDSDGNSKAGDYDDVRLVTATKHALSKQSVPPPRDAVGTINIGLGIGGAEFPAMGQVTSLNPQIGQASGIPGSLSLRSIDSYATAPESVSPSSFTTRTPMSNPALSPSSTASPSTPWSTTSSGIKRKGRPAALSLSSHTAANTSSPGAPGTPSRALQSPVVRGRTPPPTNPPDEPLPPLPPTPSTYSNAVMKKTPAKNGTLPKGSSNGSGAGHGQRNEERRGSDPWASGSEGGFGHTHQPSNQSNNSDARSSNQSTKSSAIANVATSNAANGAGPSSMSSDVSKSATAAVVAGSHLQTRAGSQRAQAMLSTMAPQMTYDEKRASMALLDGDMLDLARPSKSFEEAYERSAPSAVTRKQVPRETEAEPSSSRRAEAFREDDGDEEENLDDDDDTDVDGEDEDEEDAVSDSEPETAVVKTLTRIGSISGRRSAQVVPVARTGSVIMGEPAAEKGASSPPSSFTPQQRGITHSVSSPQLLESRQGPTNEVLAGLEKMKIVGRVRASIEKRSPSGSELATSKSPDVGPASPDVGTRATAAGDKPMTLTLPATDAPSSPSPSAVVKGSREAGVPTHPPSAWSGFGKRSPKPGHTQNNASTSSQISLGLAQQAKTVSVADVGAQPQVVGGAGHRLSQHGHQGVWTPRQAESPETSFSGVPPSSGLQTPSISGHGDGLFPDSVSSNGHVLKRRSSTVQSRREEMDEEKRTESSLSAYSERIKRAEGRFAGAFGEIALAFKNLQAEKKTLERVIRATTPLDGVNDSEGLRQYLSTMSYKLEMSASEIRKLLDLLDQQRSVMDYMLETHQLEIDSHLDEIDDLQDELDNMTAEAEMHHANATKLTEDVEKAYAEGVAVRAETLRYKTMVAEEESKREKLSSSIKALKDDLASAQGKVRSEEALHATTKERLRDMEEQHAKFVDGLGTGGEGAAENFHATNVKTMQDRIASLELAAEQHATTIAEREKKAREQDDELQAVKRQLADAHKLHEGRQREVYDELEESRRAHEETKGDLHKLSSIMSSSRGSSPLATRNSGDAAGDGSEAQRKNSSDSDSTHMVTDLSNKLEESEKEKDALRDQVVQQEKDIAELRASVALRGTSSQSSSPDVGQPGSGIPPGRADQIEALMKQLSQQRAREAQIRTAYKQLRDELRKINTAQQLDRKRGQASYSILGPPPSASSAASSLTSTSSRPFTPAGSHERLTSGTITGNSETSTSRHLKRLSLPLATFPAGGVLPNQQHSADAGLPGSASSLSSTLRQRDFQDGSGANNRILNKRAHRHASVDPTNNLWAMMAGANTNPQVSPSLLKRRSSAFGIGTLPLSKGAQPATSSAVSTNPSAEPPSSAEERNSQEANAEQDSAANGDQEEEETVESLASPQISDFPKVSSQDEEAD